MRRQSGVDFLTVAAKRHKPVIQRFAPIGRVVDQRRRFILRRLRQPVAPQRGEAGQALL